MATLAQKLYNQKIRRIQDAIALRQPDRVPFTPTCIFFPAKYAGLTFAEAMTNPQKLEAAIEKVALDFQLDQAPDTFITISWGPTLGILGFKQMIWPGHGLNSDVSYQFVEGEYMLGEEYDDFLLDPSDFIFRTYLPRTFRALKAFQHIPPIATAYYTRMVPFSAAFGTPALKEAMASLLKAGEQGLQTLKRATAFSRKMTEKGFPPAFGSAVHAPFDYLGDFFRGTKGIMLDMYRRPKKLLAAIERAYQLLIRSALVVPKLPDVHLVFIPLHKGLDGFMSLEQFKTFYWPTLKQMMLDLIEAGFTPCPLWEGHCDSRLETIADMPRGKVVYWFEQTDIFRAKQILGDHICLRGNIPASLLSVGSPEQVMDYCQKLIEFVGKDGGFIMDGGIGISDKAKPENVQAIVKAIDRYGVYR